MDEDELTLPETVKLLVARTWVQVQKCQITLDEAVKNYNEAVRIRDDVAKIYPDEFDEVDKP